MYVIQTDKNPSLECVRNKDSIDRHERSLCKRYLWGKKRQQKNKSRSLHSILNIFTMHYR